jgi:hypothetical protein
MTSEAPLLNQWMSVATDFDRPLLPDPADHVILKISLEPEQFFEPFQVYKSEHRQAFSGISWDQFL